MATELAKAYVQIVPSARGMQQGLSNIFSNEMPSAGQSAGSIFGSGLIGKLKSMIAVAGLGKMLTEALTAGADKQQSLDGIETLFKNSADTVIKNAEQAYRTAGMSANAYMETVTSFSASLLQGLSGDTQKAADVADMALTDMSDNANKMGTSMELIQNAYQGFAKQNYTMLDNLKLGYGGTKTEMERLLADAQKLTDVEYDISNLADVYSAIHAIQEEMGITGTTALEAASTFEGSLASMKAAATNVLASLSLGEDIGPALNALGETVFAFVTGNLLPMVGNILTALPEVISGAAGIVIQGLNLAANNADAIIEMGVELVTSIGSAIITALPYLAEAAWNVVTALGNAIITTDWIQVGQDTISGLRSSLDLAASEILGTDGNIVQSVLDAISINLPSVLEGGIEIVVELANGILAGLPNFLASAGELMAQLLDTIMSMLPDILVCGITMISELAAGLLSNLPAIITSATQIVADLLVTIASHLPDLLEMGISLIGEMSAGLISAIPDILSAAGEIIGEIFDIFGEIDWLSLGVDIVNGIVDGLLSAASSIWDAMVDLANYALNAAKDALGIHSPSLRFRKEVGKPIPGGVALGVEDDIGLVKQAMQDLSDSAAVDFVSSLQLDSRKGRHPRTDALGGFGRIVNVVQNIYSEAKTAADLMQEAQYQQEMAVLLGV